MRATVLPRSTQPCSSHTAAPPQPLHSGSIHLGLVRGEGRGGETATPGKKLLNCLFLFFCWPLSLSLTLIQQDVWGSTTLDLLRGLFCLEWLRQKPFKIAGQVNAAHASVHCQQMDTSKCKLCSCDKKWEDVQLGEVCSHTLNATVSVTLGGGGMQL